MQRLYSKPLTSLSENLSIVGMNGSGKSGDSYTKSDSIDGQDVSLTIQDTSDSDDIDIDDLIKWSQAIIILFSITSRRSFYRAQELVESIKQNSTIAPSSSPTTRGLTGTPQRPISSIASSGSISSAQGSIGSSTVTSPTHGSSSFRRSALCGAALLRTPTLVLVANKSDLDRFRLVQKAEAEDFAKAHGIPYFETTAADTYDKVQHVFHSVVRLSNSNRFLKPIRGGSNGTGVAMGRNLSSSTGTLGAATAGSVLSSLAVSPGLLLQKKTTIPTSLGLNSLELPENAGQSSTSLNTTSAASTLSPSGKGLQNSIISSSSAALTSTTEPLSSLNPVARLTNLRFRATSPPSLTKNHRTSSPGLPIQRPVSAESGESNPSMIQMNPSISSTTTLPRSAGRIILDRSNIPIGVHRVQSLGKAPLGTIGTNEDVKSIVITNPSTQSDNTTVNPITQPIQQTPTPPPPMAPKKVSKGFRFFSKKSK